MGQYQLFENIVKLSSASIWELAKLEWRLKDVYEAQEPMTCLCGHFPIIEICVLINKINGNFASIGNCCVKKFMGLPSDKIFQAIKRVRKNTKKSLNGEAIQHALERGWITEWERKFYLDIMHKRSLTPKQQQKKIQINEKLVFNIKVIKTAGTQTAPQAPI